MKTRLIGLLLTVQFSAVLMAQPNKKIQTTLVKTTNGTLEGVTEASGIRSYKGIPYAQPPVGDLRWKEPQPPKNWTGVQQASKFGPRAMQRAIFGDMDFRSDRKSVV